MTGVQTCALPIFTADVLLVSVGRGPVTDGIGYQEAGIAMDRGYVLVDDHRRTNIPVIVFSMNVSGAIVVSSLWIPVVGNPNLTEFPCR